MTISTQIKRPESLSKIAEEHIRKEIVRGAYKLGESLQEARLSSHMGISKTPIREALAALKLQGLVQIFPQRGAFVFTLDKEDVMQLCQYRMTLEGAAMEQAMDKNPTSLLDEFDDLLLKMSAAHKSDKFEQYLELDADFHNAFFRHCGNVYLKEGYQKASDIVKTMRTYLSKRPERTEKSLSEHKEISLLLRGGNIEVAKNVLDTHINRGVRSYSDLVNINK